MTRRMQVDELTENEFGGADPNVMGSILFRGKGTVKKLVYELGAQVAFFARQMI